MSLDTRQDQLDAAARLTDRAHDEAAYAGGMLRRGDTQSAAKHAKAAEDAAENALEILLALGARRPGQAVAADSLPLELLDTPASRRLLAALEEAQKAGEALDRERGWLHDGEPCGWGEMLGGMVLTLRVEVEGPQGKE